MEMVIDQKRTAFNKMMDLMKVWLKSRIGLIGFFKSKGISVSEVFQFMKNYQGVDYWTSFIEGELNKLSSVKLTKSCTKDDTSYPDEVKKSLATAYIGSNQKMTYPIKIGVSSNILKKWVIQNYGYLIWLSECVAPIQGEIYREYKRILEEFAYSDCSSFELFRIKYKEKSSVDLPEVHAISRYLEYFEGENAWNNRMYEHLKKLGKEPNFERDSLTPLQKAKLEKAEQLEIQLRNANFDLKNYIEAFDIAKTTNQGRGCCGLSKIIDQTRSKISELEDKIKHLKA